MKFESGKPRFLSILIKKETKGHKSPRKWYSDFYLPSFKSIFGVFLSFSVLYIVIYGFLVILSNTLKSDYLIPFDLNSNWYQNLIAIHAGIGSVIFALIIFVAESIRDEDSERARVLLSVSYLFPLTVAEIFNFLFFLFFNSIVVIVAITVIGILTIWSLGRVINTQMNQYAYKKSKTAVVISRIKHSIDLAIKERIGKNLLFKGLGTEFKLQYGYFDEPDEGTLITVRSGRYGIIDDIDLKKLDEFASLLDSEARANNFSFAKTEGQEVRLPGENSPQESMARNLTENRKRYIYKVYHDSVTEERAVLLGFDRRLVTDPRKIEKLVKLGKSAFVVKQKNSFSDEIHHDLSRMKDQFIAAIERKAIGKIDELSELYIQVAQSFLEMLEAYGFAYTFDQAIKERHTILAGWEQVNWLTADMYFLIRLALKTGDVEVITRLIHIPLAISRRALEKNDHYLFQEFIRFPELFYHSAIKLEEGELKNFLLDRSWRYIKEISDFYVESKLSNPSNKQYEVNSLKNFAIYLFKRTQALLKSAYDARDFASFNKFKTVGLQLFSRFIRNRDHLDSSFIEMELNNPDLSEDERTKIERRLKDVKFREKIQEEVFSRKYQMFFGISSWILSELKIKKDDKEIGLFFESARSVFGFGIEKFTQIFLDSHSFETEDFWNWDRWELIPEGEARFIDVFGKLERFFVVQSLLLLIGLDNHALQGLKLPFNRDFVSLIEGGRDLNKIISSIKNNPNDWLYVLTPEAITKISAFEALLQDVKERHQEEEAEQIRNSNISSKKVLDFIGEVVKEFSRTADLRSIFTHFNSIDFVYKENEQFQFGISQVDEKAAFFDDWPVHYLDWGLNYGQGLAAGEDKKFISELSKRCLLSIESFEKVVDDKSGHKDLLIIVVNNNFEFGIRRSERFVPDWIPEIKKLSVNGFGGWFKSNGLEVPVFEIYVNDSNESYALVFRASEMGRISQYKPPTSPAAPEPINGIFSISVQSFSEDERLLTKFLDNPPPWLTEKGDRHLQEMYLRGRVLIDVFESFEYSNPMEQIGVRIDLTPVK